MTQKNTIRAMFLFSVVVLAIFVYGCSSAEPVPVEVNDSGATAEGVSNVITANNKFAFDLYSRYSSNEGNVFFSPYSISTALAMTYEGARGQTAEEMQKVFYFPEDDSARRAGYASLYNQINQGDKKYKLSTANALWAEQDFAFLDEYFSLINQYYDGKVTNLDFKQDPEGSRVTINNWVEDNTNDKIKDLIPVGIIDSSTRLVLTNAVYFKANWSRQFDAEDTTDGHFKLSSRETVDSKMMNQEGYYKYGETGDLQILEMDYLGDELSMLIVLPKETGLDQIEKTFTNEKLSELKENMQTERVRVALPKFKFETKYFMADTLKEMGMPTAFNQNLADFTGMWNRQSNENLYISQVIHQTFIEVAEYGTEAAAATAVIIAETTAVQQPEQPKIFDADHPFIFVIQEKQTGEILFMGRMANPNT